MKNVIPQLFRTILITLLFFTGLYAQQASNIKANNTGTVSGKVIDLASKNPVEFASVVLKSKHDSKIVTGIATNKDGEFILPGVPFGAYDMEITFVGFKKKTLKDVNVTENKQYVNLKDISLSGDALQMKENEVTAEKNAVEFKIDKKVINVAQNLSAAGGTAVDVLQNQPGVQVDANGNITLRGNSDFIVMVDGRPSVLQGTDALRQIAANTIDNIELITNPSAKYDAEGTAGIINIVTKRINRDNMNGMVNSGVSSRNKYNGDFNFNDKTEDYNITAAGEGRRYSSIQTIDINREQDNSQNILGSAALSNIRDSYNARFGYDRYISDKTTLSFNGSYGRLNVDQFVNTINSTNDGLNTPLILSTITGDHSLYKPEYYSGTFNYSHTYQPKVNDISFEVMVTKLYNPSDQRTVETFFDPSSTGIRGLENNSTRYTSRLKLNYSYKFSQKNVFETGLQTNLFYKSIDLIGKEFDQNIQQWNIIDSLSSNFKFRNNVYAGFMTYSDQLAGFDYQGGVRLEYTDRLLDPTGSTEKFQYEKLHFFPTLNISRNISDDQQIQFSFSRRINRPNEFMINPFNYFSDSYTVTGGNPKLVPSFTNSMELNYQKSFKGVNVTVQTYYRNTEDGIEQTQTLLPNNQLNLNWANALNTSSIGAEITANITFAPWFKLDPSLNLYNYKVDENMTYDVTGQSNFAWDSKINATFMLSAATRIQFYTNYYAKNLTSQGEIKSFAIIGASIRQEFFNRQLIATLSAQNLFNQMQYNLSSTGIGFVSYVLVKPEAPIFNLTLSYNFNNFQRKNVEKVDVNLNEGL
jgi:outer membrane receptor protein involved in Fe transport